MIILENINTNAVSNLAELVNKYGFMLVFSAVGLLIIIWFAYSLSNRLNKNFQQRAEADAEKTRIELSLMEKEKLADFDKRTKLFSLVTDVQTKQISQLDGITDAIKMIKDEIENISGEVSDNKSEVAILNKNHEIMIKKYEELAKIISKLEEVIDINGKRYKEIQKSLTEIRESVKEISDELNEQ